MSINEKVKKVFVNTIIICILFVSMLCFIPYIRESLLGLAEIILHKKTNYFEYNMIRLNVFAWSLLVTAIFAVIFYNVKEKDVKYYCMLLCGFFSLVMFFCIILNPGWIISDDREFLSTIALHKIRDIHIEDGRFWNQYEYNILLLTPFYNKIAAYYVINGIEYLVLCFSEFLCIKFIIEKNKETVSKFTYFLIAFFHIVIHTWYIQAFNEIIYGEKLLVTLTTVMTYLLLKAYDSGKLRYWLFAFICVPFMTYLKEPVFGALIVLAICLLISKWEDKGLKLFSFLTILNGIIFILLYYFISYRNATNFYANEVVGGNFVVRFVKILNVNPILIPMIVLFIYRLVISIKEKMLNITILDSLLLTGLAYFFAMYLLKMGGDTYMYPCYGFGLLSLIFGINEIFTKWTKICSITNFLFVLVMPFLLYVGFYDMWRLQTDRKIDQILCEEVINVINKNPLERGTVYWYTGEAGGSWQRKIMQDFFIFLLNDESFKIEDCPTFPSTINENDVLLFASCADEYSEEKYPEIVQRQMEKKTVHEHFYMYTKK